MPVNASNEKLGWKAPNFNLKNIDDINYQFEDLVGVNGTVICFICNHCPYVISLANRLSYEAKDLKKNGINTIAIMSNDTSKYPEDSFDNMKIFANKYNFDFPYLYDETQDTAKEFGAVCTPDIFGFNRKLLLQYRGRLDSAVMNKKEQQIKRELYEAMIKIKFDDIGPSIQKNSFGCSIKWK